MRVRELREAKGLRQIDLAYRAGLAPSVVSEIENGKREPRAGTLRKLAAVLEVEVPDLYPKGQARLFAEEPRGIPARELDALRRWIGYLEPRVRANELGQEELNHAIDGALAFGMERAIQLPPEDKERFQVLGYAMLDEARELAALHAEFREMTEHLEAR